MAKAILSLLTLLFSSVSAYYVFPVILSNLLMSYSQIGVLMGVFSASTALFRPFFGKLVTLVGEKRVITLGIALATVSCFLYLFFPRSFWVIFAIRSLHGIGFSAIIAGAFSMLSRGVQENARHGLFLKVGIVIMGSSALTPLLVEISLGILGEEALYVSTGLLSLGTLPFLTKIKEETISSPGLHGKNAGFFKVLKHHRFLLLLFVTFTFAHSQATLFNFVGLWMLAHGLGMGGVYIWLCLGTAILGSLILLKRAREHPYTVSMGLFFFLLGIWLLAQNNLDLKIFILSAVLTGFSTSLIFADLNYQASISGKDSEKPMIMSLFTATYDMGFVTGTMASGRISSIYGLGFLFEVTAMVVLFSLLGSVLYGRSREEMLKVAKKPR